MFASASAPKRRRKKFSAHFWVAVVLTLILLFMWLMGYGPGGGTVERAPLPAEAPVARVTPLPPVTANEPAPVPVVPPTATPPAVTAPPAKLAIKAADTRRNVRAGLASVYFASNSAETPDGIENILADVIAELQTNPKAKAALAGFHSPKGSKEINEALARQRTKAVQSTLVKAGISAERMVIINPADAEGTGKSFEARRVEVRVLRHSDAPGAAQ